MATIIDLAEAVMAELNHGKFSRPLTAKRYYLPRFALEEMNTLHVSVVPATISTKQLDRNRDSFDYVIEIAVQQKTDMNAAELDGLMTFVEELAEYFRKQPLASFPGARCIEVVNEPVYAPEHLEAFRQFTSVLSLTYRVWR